MDTLQTFITQAIGAASVALAALASGQRLESDNLIAGALALELVMGRDDLTAYRFNGINVAIRGLRALAMRQAMAQTPGGKLAADSFAVMLDGALAQWGMQNDHQGSAS